jgi:hypothetical protein
MENILSNSEKPFEVKKLLFVCVENSNRSQMSQAFAKILGGKQIEAYSAGSKPSGVVNPKAIDSNFRCNFIKRVDRVIFLENFIKNKFYKKIIIYYFIFIYLRRIFQFRFLPNLR